MGDLKYKVGDKVRIKSIDWYEKNKDILCGDILCGEHYFVEGMKKFCSEIFEISDIVVDGYLMLEDIDDYIWTDEMIECKLEEECPQDFIEKYCISCGTQRCDRTKEYLDGCPYYNEYMSIKQNNAMEDENNHLTETVVDTVRESNDRYRIVIDPRFDIEVDEGEYYAVRRKKEYPKTFEECCKVLEIEGNSLLINTKNITDYERDLGNLIGRLHRLIICRDAYWKIAGEEMGLDKPWEPDWREGRYIIYLNQDDIIGGYRKAGFVEHHIFAFPTKEMRDTFKENFKKDIEKCKELL